MGRDRTTANARGMIGLGTRSDDVQAPPPLATLPATRREILQTIKRRGEARAEDIANELGITVSGVRQHLTGLEAMALVEHRELKSGPGRPRFLYRLTEHGEGLFPRAYGELVQEMLLFLDDEAPDLVARMFARRTAARIERANLRLAGKTFGERVHEIVRILDEDGYLAEVEAMDDGGYRIVEHNCAILSVALRHPRVCSNEIDFLTTLLPEATIERTRHIVNGEASCCYVVREQPSPDRHGTVTFP